MPKPLIATNTAAKTDDRQLRSDHVEICEDSPRVRMHDLQNYLDVLWTVITVNNATRWLTASNQQ